MVKERIIRLYWMMLTLQVTQLSKMLDSLLEVEMTEFDILEAFFLQALYWSLGAGLLEDGRVRFDIYVKGMASMAPKEEDFAGPGRCCLMDFRLFRSWPWAMD